MPNYPKVLCQLLEQRKSARSTWALADKAATGAVGLADWEVSLAVGSANFKVGSADSEQADNLPFLLVGV